MIWEGTKKKDVFRDIQAICTGTDLLFPVCYTTGFSLSCFSSESSSDPEKEDTNAIRALERRKKRRGGVGNEGGIKKQTPTGNAYQKASQSKDFPRPNALSTLGGALSHALMPRCIKVSPIYRTP